MNAKIREELVALTVKLSPDVYLALKERGMLTKPRKTNQEMLVEAIHAYLATEDDSTQQTLMLGN